MTRINAKELEAVDTSDLKEKMKELADELARREREEKFARAQVVERVALEQGFASINEAARVMAGRFATANATVTYCNPDNPEETWSGRGRKPKWLHSFQMAGGKLDDLPVLPAPAAPVAPSKKNAPRKLRRTGQS